MLSLVFLSPASFALDMSEVRLVGLFSGTAVLMIEGRQEVIRLGEQSRSNIALIATDSSTATLSYEGKSYTVGLSRSISDYVPARKVTAVVKADDQGQYFSYGSINDQPVTMLVDTGATSVAMNTGQARRLGIDFAAGELSRAETAGGMVKAYRVTLDRVKLGDIELSNIGAAVLEGVHPPFVLLGMSFLTHVKIEESNGILRLSQDL